MIPEELFTRIPYDSLAVAVGLALAAAPFI